MFMLNFVAIVICFCDRVGFDRVDFGVSNAEGGVKIFIVLALIIEWTRLKSMFLHKFRHLSSLYAKVIRRQ